jgi:hypothetical protein
VSPFRQNSEFTGDRFTFMIDGDAKEGDMPKYGPPDNQRALLCGFASHSPPGGKGGEMIRPIFRDDFCLWGHIEEGGKRWKILPMYFIPHGGGIVGLTNITKYKFSKPETFSRRVAAPAPTLQTIGRAEVDDPQDPLAAQIEATNGTATTNDKDKGVEFDSDDKESAPTEGEQAELLDDQQGFKQPLTEADFGAEAAAADQAAADHEKDW